MTDKFSWYINRLKTMSIPEVFYRAGQAFQKVREKAVEKKFPVQHDQLTFPADFTSPVLDEEFFASFPTPAPGYTFFGQHIDIFKDIDWHLDISSGKVFPRSFSKDINIRSDKYGSAKVVWEINRLQFLLPLVLEYLRTKDRSKLDRFTDLLASWKNENAYLRGVNWYSNIEVNIRLINWYWCWLVLSGDSEWRTNKKYKQFREDVWLPLIYQHCYYSYKNPSLYSSANNHLISEYAGLFMASVLWKFPGSSKWLKYSSKGLEKEIVNQHSTGGVNKEEAAEYIQFITDFFLLPYIAGEQHGHPFSTGFKDYLLRIGKYINDFLDMRGNFPRYGDEDDGRVIIPDGDTHGNNFISILNTLCVVFDNPSLKHGSAKWDIKSALLTGSMGGRKKWDNFPAPEHAAGSSFYEAEGHFIFRKQFDRQREIYCHFDAAPLGYLSIAAHGHADALSCFMNIDGFPFLVDPGTFTYHTHPAWRKYFVSTAAHNTIVIDGQDQAVLSGPTMWTVHYTPKTIAVTKNGALETVCAEHNGYAGKGILHRRTIAFNRNENRFLITDEINNAGDRSYEATMPFHLHPEISMVKKTDGQFEFSHPRTSAKLELHTDPQLGFSYTEATEADPVGWYSPSFMIRQPASVLTGRVSATKSIHIQTTLKIIF